MEDEEEINERKRGEEGEEEGEGMSLELGDLVEIISPTNSDYHQQVFFINYINRKRIELINVENYQLENLTLDDFAMITDESITEINLLSRSEEKGFARQKGLLPKKWIDIHFGGEVPTILTGEITNLEEDEIEIRTFPENEVIFLNFEYQGIPEDIPLEKIVLRDPPRAALLEKLSDQMTADVEEGEEGFLEEATIQTDEFYEYSIHIPDKMTPEENIREALQSVYLNANELFGEDLEDIFQVVEIPESEKKYTIDLQINDFTDELLSTIPNIKRTHSVMNRIHTLVERFKQLRDLYSQFDDHGNVLGKKIYGDMYKPIVQHITDLDVKFRWLIPVVQQSKKLYQLEHGDEEAKEDEDEEDDELTDAFVVKNKVEFNRQYQQTERYTKNTVLGEQNKYHYLLNTYGEFMEPFESPPPVNREDFLVFKREVKTDLEAIVNNLGDFYSTTMGQTSKKKYSKCRYLLQKYNLGESRVSLEPAAKKGVFLRKKEKGDVMTIKSLIMMPESVMKYSHLDLPHTNILLKSNLGQVSLDYFRIFKKKRDIKQKIILDLKKEFDYEKGGEETSFLKEVTEYILEDSFNQETESEKYKKFLNVIFPKIRDLIRLLKGSMENPYALSDIVHSLEPFMIYTDNITYGQYNEIRYFIKEKMKEYKIHTNEKSQTYQTFRNMQYNIRPVVNRILTSFSEKKDVEDIFLDSYSMGGDNPTKTVRSSSEQLLQNIQRDNNQLYAHLLTFLLLSLVTPNKLMESLENPALDFGEDKVSKPGSCPRRFITKKYTSIGDLQKDNNVEVLHYDKEMDDTPYALLKKYEDAKKTMLPEKFVLYLAENLVQKHECPRDESVDLAKTLIAGKKEVRDGEYAMVVFKPALEKVRGNDISQEWTEKEKKEMALEEQAKTYYHYYKRLSHNWIRDHDIDEEAFYDNNTLFCNIDMNCLKNTAVKTCDPTDFAEMRMKQITSKRALSEFDKRFSMTVEELTQQLEKSINYHRSFLKKNGAIQENLHYKSNFIAFEIGKYSEHSDVLVSPYAKLYDLILSQYDFPKKQMDLCKLVDLYCREPLYQEHGESPHWLYCKETNTPLVPQSLYQLADVFVSGGDYLLKLDELCHSIGQISDDGNSWTDKFCGCELRKIDYVSEEGYDEAGFMIQSHSMLEKDLGTVATEALSSQKKEKKVFEDETTNVTYHIFHAICSQMDVPIEVIESFVLRISMEMITNPEILLEEKSYQRRIEKIEKTKGKAQAPFAIYRHQTIITIVGGLILVAIQAVIPSLKVKKTFPGCVRSFSGYPMGGVEDMTGLQYIACVIHKIKSSISPWDSIEKLNAASLEKRMREVLDRYVVQRQDIVELFLKKKEYLEMHPGEQAVDKEHSVSKWRHFMPPIVDFTLSKAAQGTSREFDKDFVEQIRKGSKDQQASLCVYKSKGHLFGCAVIEAINHIVQSKGLLLQTMAKVPFLENACCNEGEWTHPITYFAKEDKNLVGLIQKCEKNEAILRNVRAVTQASLFYYEENTTIQRPEISKDFTTDNIYQAFIHYGHFDVDSPIPDDLALICRDKPAGLYNPRASLEEKIEFLKRNGKRYTTDDLNQLLRVIHQRNTFHLDSREIPSNPVVLFREYLEHLESKHSTLVEEPLRKLLFQLLEEYRPNVLVDEADKEQTPFNIAITRLRNYLIKTNEKMYQQITGFIDQYGNLSNKHFNELQNVLLNVTQWDAEKRESEGSEAMFTVTQNIKNAVFSLTKVYPHLILNSAENTTTPVHWGLSPKHMQDIAQFVSQHTYAFHKYQTNYTISKWLENIASWEEDINQFLKLIPVNTPIVKDGVVFFDFLDKRTLYMLYTYCWYSVLFELIQTTQEEDLIRMDIRGLKEDRRREIDESKDASNFLDAVSQHGEEDTAEYEEELLQIEITSGEKKELQKTACSLLLDFISVEQKNKKAIDYPYAQIARRVKKTKEAEKKSITDFLQNMEKDERNIEGMLRKYKMGRWNIGLQKGLLQYDKKIYDENRDSNIARLYDEFAEHNEFAEAEPESFGVEELEAAEQQEIADLYDAEGIDISGLGEEYGDGNYYEEDRDPDDM